MGTQKVDSKSGFCSISKGIQVGPIKTAPLLVLLAIQYKIQTPIDTLHISQTNLTDNIRLKCNKRQIMSKNRL